MNDHQDDWLEAAVKREGPLLFSDHARSEDLVLYAEDPATLEAGRRTRLEEHLRLCDDCAEDLARLRLADAELAAGPAPVRSGRRFQPAFLVPLAAAALVAFAVIGLDRGGPPVRPVGPAVILRAETERGVATPLPAHSGLTLSFELPGDGEGPIQSCKVRILDAGGGVAIDVGRMEAFDGFGTFLLALDPGALASGEYVLEAQDRLGKRRFPVVLQAAGKIPDPPNK